MHDAAYDWIEANWVPGLRVVEIGGRNANYGTVRDLWPEAMAYTSVDLLPGPGVDWVGDFLDYNPALQPDVIVSTEVLEHCDYWPTMLRRAADLLMNGGTLLVTAAGPDRLPHSGVDGGPLRDGEFYENVDPSALYDVLDSCFTIVKVETDPGHPLALAPTGKIGDVYAKAIK